MPEYRSAAGTRTLTNLGKNKARLILLNKADLAEDKWNDAWSEYFREKGILCRESEF